MKQEEAVVETTIDTAATETVSEDTEYAVQTDDVAKPTSEATQNACVDEQAGGHESKTDAFNMVFKPVYNGEVMPVSANDTARVTTLLQKGMKFEHMAGDLEKLHRLATVCGAKSVTEVIDLLTAQKEQEKREAYVAQYGEQAAQRLLELECAQCGSFQEIDEASDRASQEALETRLAREFAELQSMHEQIGSVQDVPQEAITLALEKGISLLDAYNRHTLTEQKRVASAAQQQFANQTATTGSLTSGGGETLDPVWEAFVRGAARAMR